MPRGTVLNRSYPTGRSTDANDAEAPVRGSIIPCTDGFSRTPAPATSTDSLLSYVVTSSEGVAGRRIVAEIDEYSNGRGISDDGRRGSRRR